MSYRIPAQLLIAAGALVVVMMAARDGGDAATMGDQVLYTTDGTRIDAVFDGKAMSFKALVAQGSGKVALEDGTYKLDNGGAIRVKDGVIVWDAFGVIDKLEAAGEKGQGAVEGPSGLG